MKTAFKPFISSWLFCAAALLPAHPLAASVTSQPLDAATNAPIPWDQIGAKAGADYHGDGLAVTASGDGAKLHCAFQRLDGEATPQGLWLASTVANTPVPNDRFRVAASALNGTALPDHGRISMDGSTVRFTRPGLMEESASAWTASARISSCSKNLAAPDVSPLKHPPPPRTPANCAWN